MDQDTNASRYNAIWDLTQQMLVAARDGEWDQLTTLEQARSTLAMELAAKHRENPVPLTEASAEIIRKISACDEEIRVLAEARLMELKAVLDSVNTERKLFKAYNTEI